MSKRAILLSVVRVMRRALRSAAPYLTRKHALLAGVAVVAALFLTLLGIFLWPRVVIFSYAQDNCITHPVVLPGLISKKQGATYAAEPVTSLSVAGYPLYSHTTCITPIQAPAEHAEDAIGFGSALLMKDIRISTGAFPALANGDMLKKAISARDPLLLELDTVDRVFEYRLLANGKNTGCIKESRSLECHVSALELEQSKTYEFALERLFDGTPAQTVFERPLVTVESVHIAKASINAGQTVYDAPDALTLTLNRAVESAAGAQLYRTNGDKRQAVAISAEVDGKTVTVTFDEPLQRQASFRFTIDDIRAADGGFLAAPYSLPFKTSGGPQVRGANIGNYKVPVGGSIILNFDSPVSEEQNLAEFVRIEANGDRVAATITGNGSAITIDPERTLPRCAPLTLRVLDGLENEHGISGGSAWQFNSRSMCQVVSSIGTSVQGRVINAYRFGTGNSTVVYVGGTHGDERSSVHTLNQWIEQLEANPGRIPAHRSIVVIPNVNPDGFAAGTRNNANNVDLNRNFPANNWKSDVTHGDGTHLPKGGGSKPLSEPESRALANYVLGLSPRLVLTYHAVAGYVIPNDSGDSDAQARSYAQHSDLRYASNAQTGALFPYDTTGAFEDWLHDKHGIPALLLELWTKTVNEYSDNQSAMWRMVGL